MSFDQFSSEFSGLIFLRLFIVISQLVIVFSELIANWRYPISDCHTLEILFMWDNFCLDDEKKSIFSVGYDEICPCEMAGTGDIAHCTSLFMWIILYQLSPLLD